jgi:hypothetical protein
MAVLSDWMTRAEHTLLARGHQDLIAQSRRHLHGQVATNALHRRAGHRSHRHRNPKAHRVRPQHRDRRLHPQPSGLAWPAAGLDDERLRPRVQGGVRGGNA